MSSVFCFDWSPWLAGILSVLYANKSALDGEVIYGTVSALADGARP